MQYSKKYPGYSRYNRQYKKSFTPRKVEVWLDLLSMLIWQCFPGIHCYWYTLFMTIYKEVLFHCLRIIYSFLEQLRKWFVIISLPVNLFFFTHSSITQVTCWSQWLFTIWWFVQFSNDEDLYNSRMMKGILK